METICPDCFGLGYDELSLMTESFCLDFEELVCATCKGLGYIVEDCLA